GDDVEARAEGQGAPAPGADAGEVDPFDAHGSDLFREAGGEARRGDRRVGGVLAGIAFERRVQHADIQISRRRRRVAWREVVGNGLGRIAPAVDDHAQILENDALGSLGREFMH
ncbi:MAG: hypothetical protein ACK56I_13025, partial [bacterium]